jgi:hypothetical protein
VFSVIFSFFAWPNPGERLVLGNLAAWTHGACIVYPSEIFDPKEIVDAVVKERCTALHGVPTHFLGVLSEFERRESAGEKPDMSSLRFVLEFFARPSYSWMEIGLVSLLDPQYRST